MNFKTTYILFAAMLVMVGVLAVILLYHGKSEDRKDELLFPTAASKDKDRQVRSDDVTVVTIQRKKPADKDLVFERGDDKTWTITSPRKLRAESSRVTNLIDSILSARTDAENTPESLKKAGLDSPSRIISLYAKDKDRTLKLTVGEVTPGTESALAFVMSSDRPNTPLAVKKTSIDSALEDVGYFRSKDLLGEGPSNDIRAIKVSEGKKGTVEVRKEKDRWRFVQPAYGDAEIDNNFLNTLDNVKVEYKSDKDNDFVEDGVTDLGKIDKDLPKSEQLRITVERGDEGSKKKPTTATLVVLVSKKVGDKYYAYVENGKEMDVVKVTASSIQPFLDLVEKPEDRRNKSLVALEPFRSPDAIDVKNSYGLIEFRKPEGSNNWQLYRNGAANPTDEAEVRKLIDVVTRSKAVSFVDPKRKKELGLDKPDVDTVRIWSDSLEKTDTKDKEKPKEKDKEKGKDKSKEKSKEKEKKEKGKPAFKKDVQPVTELRFGNREGDNVAIERIWGKDSTIVMAPASILEQVRQRPLAYYDKHVPGFSTGLAADMDVTRLILNRGGEVIELKREKSGAPWKFVQPKNLKDRNASAAVVSEILSDLNMLMVKEVVSDKATTEQLKTYGLTKPAYRAVVTLTKDKKDTTHSFMFGNDAAGKGVYAKLGGKDAIYLVDSRVIDDLKKELRDTTVLAFDADKVTTLKLTGWRKLLGSPGTRTLTSKDGKWTSKEIADVDPEKVKRFLEGLSNLKAERFVASGKGLKLTEDALQVEITLADKKVLEVTVGAAEGNSFYATSNQLKGEVFLVPKDLFEGPRSAPGYFHK
jgi:hypothetical protein